MLAGTDLTDKSVFAENESVGLPKYPEQLRPIDDEDENDIREPCHPPSTPQYFHCGVSGSGTVLDH